MVEPNKNINKIKINIDDILDQFDCSICMCKFKDPYIVKCGHTFCKVFPFDLNNLGVHS